MVFREARFSRTVALVTQLFIITPDTGHNSLQIEPPAPAKTLHRLLEVTLDYKHLFKYHRLIDEEPL